MTPEKLSNRQEEILELIAPFCVQKLSDEYFVLAGKLLKMLAEIEPSPFEKGQPQIWAAGIIQALGSINWMFDRDNPHYTPAKEINAFFGTKSSTVSQKASLIKDLLDLDRGDPDLSTQHTRANDPFANIVMMDGLFVSMDMLPQHLQEQVRKLRAEGHEVTLTTQ